MHDLAVCLQPYMPMIGPMIILVVALALIRLLEWLTDGRR